MQKKRVLKGKRKCFAPDEGLLVPTSKPEQRLGLGKENLRYANRSYRFGKRPVHLTYRRN